MAQTRLICRKKTKHTTIKTHELFGRHVFLFVLRDLPSSPFQFFAHLGRLPGTTRKHMVCLKGKPTKISIQIMIHMSFILDCVHCTFAAPKYQNDSENATSRFSPINSMEHGYDINTSNAKRTREVLWRSYLQRIGSTLFFFPFYLHFLLSKLWVRTIPFTTAVLRDITSTIWTKKSANANVRL